MNRVEIILVSEEVLLRMDSAGRAAMSSYGAPVESIKDVGCWMLDIF